MKETIERKIASIVEQMPGWSYLYDDYRAINQRLDNTPLPCVACAIPYAGAIQVSGTQYRDSAQTSIAFAMACELDHDGVLLDGEVLERCKRAAIAFIGLCNNSGLFEQLGSQDYDVFINQYDANVAGVVIHPVMTELRGVSTCASAEEVLDE